MKPAIHATLVILNVLLIAGFVYVLNTSFQVAPKPVGGTSNRVQAGRISQSEAPPASAPAIPSEITATPADFIAPIAGAATRVTKKPFGLLVTKKNSPVQPERFNANHAGTDFETTPAEQSTEVPIMAACSGKLLLKKWATGYGGVAVQSCVVGGQAVTVIYGHLRLASIGATVGTTVKQGEMIGLLGKGHSPETDGERKHLHLGAHKGAAIDIKGYEQSASALADWLDAAKLIVVDKPPTLL